jgi:hypothetical protein
VPPKGVERFQELVAAIAEADDRNFALAGLADFLRALPSGEFQRAVALAPRTRLDPLTLNHLAGTIELAAERRGVQAPDWTRDVPIPATPTFGSSLASLRLHLLTRAPVALRRRNLFMDASLDDRV